MQQRPRGLYYFVIFLTDASRVRGGCREAIVEYFLILASCQDINKSETPEWAEASCDEELSRFTTGFGVNCLFFAFFYFAFVL